MSAILETNEPQGSETVSPLNVEDVQDHEGNDSTESLSERDNVPEEVSDEVTQDEQGKETAAGDKGGAGDVGGETHEDRGTSDEPEETSTKSKSVHETLSTKSGSVRTDSKSSGSKTRSVISSISRSTRESEESSQRGSLQRIEDEETDAHSSGFQIVSQILEELIDEIVNKKELEDVPSFESVKGSLKGDGEFQISSTTIKSEEEQGSIQINEELEAQLEFETQAAVLQQQEIYKNNVAQYHCLVSERMCLQQKNSYLLKQIYEHYKRKKIEHLFKEMSLTNIDIEGKYIRVLLAYDEVQKAAEEEEMKMYKQVNSLEEKTKAVEFDLEEENKNFLNRERDVAKGLISTQTAKPLSDKTIEGLIQRQIIKSNEVASQRHTYFKLRDAVAADESLLKSLENLGENFTLMEYEQLKMQSQSCVEKLEERDADLHRLRNKATSAIQVLAEVREKTQTLQEDIEASKVVLQDVIQQLTQTRGRLACEKKRRDMSRSDTVRLRHEAGLLSEPKLLQDYMESLAEKERLLTQLQDWKSKFESQKQNIQGLRKTLAALQQKATLSV